MDLPENSFRPKFKDADPWGYFWSETMILTLRACCYAANFLFFLPLYQLSMHRILVDVLIALWALGSYELLYQILLSKYNPAYKKLELSSEERTYRLRGERVLFAAWSTSLINAVIGFLSASLLGLPQQFGTLGFGLVGLFFGSLATLFACICLTAQSIESGKRSLIGIALGLMIMLFPAYFIYEVISTAW